MVALDLVAVLQAGTGDLVPGLIVVVGIGGVLSSRLLGRSRLFGRIPGQSGEGGHALPVRGLGALTCRHALPGCACRSGGRCSGARTGNGRHRTVLALLDDLAVAGHQGLQEGLTLGARHGDEGHAARQVGNHLGQRAGQFADLGGLLGLHAPQQRFQHALGAGLVKWQLARAVAQSHDHLGPRMLGKVLDAFRDLAAREPRTHAVADLLAQQVDALCPAGGFGNLFQSGVAACRLVGNDALGTVQGLADHHQFALEIVQHPGHQVLDVLDER